MSATAAAQSDATPAFRDVDSMQARAQGCTTCHGRDGQGTRDGAFPRIAGKPAGYLYNQLIAFRDGTRVYPPMNGAAATRMTAIAIVHRGPRRSAATCGMRRATRTAPASDRESEDAR